MPTGHHYCHQVWQITHYFLCILQLLKCDTIILCRSGIWSQSQACIASTSVLIGAKFDGVASWQIHCFPNSRNGKWQKNKSVFSGPWHWKHDIYKTESDMAIEKYFSQAAVSHALYCWSFIFWSTCLSSFMVFLPFSIFLNEEWKERYCILTRVFPFGSFFFF